MYKFNLKTNQSGFTLIELSIVIVIIGFIIGGIALGYSLIKQSAIRAIISDFQSYKTSYVNFNARYYGIPGDLTRATTYWPDTAGVNACGATTAYCNGDGDELITSANNEGRKAWRHLSLANMLSQGIPAMIAGNYNTVSGATMPISSGMSSANLIMAAYNTNGGIFDNAAPASPWNGTYKNSIYIGKPNTTAATGDTQHGLNNGSLGPDDAFVIDQKMDDGLFVAGTGFTGGSTGVIRAVNDNGTNVGTDDCLLAGNYYASNTTSNKAANCLVGYQLN